MSGSGGGEIVFPSALLERLEAWSLESYPLEACGLLIGRRGGERVEVVDVRRSLNVARERAHERFEIAPHDLMSAEREAMALRLSLVGTWHSHPDGPATLSELDRAAAWPDSVQAVVAVSRSRARTSFVRVQPRRAARLGM